MTKSSEPKDDAEQRFALLELGAPPKDARAAEVSPPVAEPAPAPLANPIGDRVNVGAPTNPRIAASTLQAAAVLDDAAAASAALERAERAYRAQTLSTPTPVIPARTARTDQGLSMFQTLSLVGERTRITLGDALRALAVMADRHEIVLLDSKVQMREVGFQRDEMGRRAPQDNGAEAELAFAALDGRRFLEIIRAATE